MKMFFENTKNAQAFTLAEVLITLTIIGVIAVLTIPNLIKKWEDSHTVASVKQSYSMLDNALRQVFSEEGGGYFWDMPWKTASSTDGNAKYIFDLLSRHLKFSDFQCPGKTCATKYGNKYDKTIYVGSTLANNNGSTDQYVAQLRNGMTIAIIMTNTTNKNWTAWNCPNYINVDINGHEKGPNKVGYDRFRFIIGYTGLTLSQYDHGENVCYNANKPEYCHIGRNAYGQTNSLESCPVWIIKHGNVDYKYRDIRNEW